ncbi:hypothetical protein LX32DRAFT_395295 [Colletotrichum zoysiae]|uniref:Uncharacterized protein n=1 Tax=Colletotrichum zoysiae TaxID=1216348 RepID=A0AAD9M902_9PEZI|nr:hypothetical protein LX32DRAFT_395295 [Colletotrichum zoysiae]
MVTFGGWRVCFGPFWKLHGRNCRMAARHSSSAPDTSPNTPARGNGQCRHAGYLQSPGPHFPEPGAAGVCVIWDLWQLLISISPLLLVSTACASVCPTTCVPIGSALFAQPLSLLAFNTAENLIRIDVNQDNTRRIARHYRGSQDNVQLHLLALTGISYARHPVPLLLSPLSLFGLLQAHTLLHGVRLQVLPH